MRLELRRLPRAWIYHLLRDIALAATHILLALQD
jgi:hypothetical protein